MEPKELHWKVHAGNKLRHETWVVSNVLTTCSKFRRCGSVAILLSGFFLRLAWVLGQIPYMGVQKKSTLPRPGWSDQGRRLKGELYESPYDIHLGAPHCL